VEQQVRRHAPRARLLGDDRAVGRGVVGVEDAAAHEVGGDPVAIGREVKRVMDAYGRRAA
jgi:hypothetical protein